MSDHVCRICCWPTLLGSEICESCQRRQQNSILNELAQRRRKAKQYRPLNFTAAGAGHPDPEEQGERIRKWFDDHGFTADIAANRGLKQRCGKYGLTVEQWMQMVIDQDSHCAICKTPRHPLKLFIDHDHEGGHVRGLLCSTCNTGLGFLGIDGPESHDRASAVISYLRWQANRRSRVG